MRCRKAIATVGSWRYRRPGAAVPAGATSADGPYRVDHGRLRHVVALRLLFSDDRTGDGSGTLAESPLAPSHPSETKDLIRAMTVPVLLRDARPASTSRPKAASAVPGVYRETRGNALPERPARIAIRAGSSLDDRPRTSTDRRRARWPNAHGKDARDTGSGSAHPLIRAPT